MFIPISATGFLLRTSHAKIQAAEPAFPPACMAGTPFGCFSDLVISCSIFVNDSMLRQLSKTGWNQCTSTPAFSHLSATFGAVEVHRTALMLLPYLSTSGSLYHFQIFSWLPSTVITQKRS